MSALLSTLPATIPGLCRPCSPVSCSVAHGIVEDVIIDVLTDDVALKIAGIRKLLPAADWSLRLDDPTGRAHAAWWALDRDGFGLGLDHGELIEDATQGANMTPAQIDTLARLVLRLAGR